MPRGVVRWQDSLHGIGGHAELQVHASAKAPARLYVRDGVNDERGLLESKRVRARVVRAQRQDTIGRPIPIVLVEGLDGRAEHQSGPRIVYGRLSLRLFLFLRCRRC